MVTAEKRGVGSRELLYGLFGIVVGVLVLGGVWFATGQNSEPIPTVTEVTPYDAPDFTLKNLEGESVSLSDYRGNVVLLNFWGTWCEPCKEETPALESAYRGLKDEGLVILGVDLLNAERSNQRGLDDVRRFVALYDVTYPIVLDETGKASQSYGIAPIPTSIFIDRDGKVRYIRIGPLQTTDVERIFRRLQSETANAYSG